MRNPVIPASAGLLLIVLITTGCIYALSVIVSGRSVAAGNADPPASVVAAPTVQIEGCDAGDAPLGLNWGMSWPETRTHLGLGPASPETDALYGTIVQTTLDGAPHLARLHFGESGLQRVVFTSPLRRLSEAGLIPNFRTLRRDDDQPDPLALPSRPGPSRVDAGTRLLDAYGPPVFVSHRFDLAVFQSDCALIVFDRLGVTGRKPKRTIVWTAPETAADALEQLRVELESADLGLTPGALAHLLTTLDMGSTAFTLRKDVALGRVEIRLIAATRKIEVDIVGQRLLTFAVTDDSSGIPYEAIAPIIEAFEPERSPAEHEAAMKRAEDDIIMLLKRPGATLSYRPARAKGEANRFAISRYYDLSFWDQPLSIQPGARSAEAALKALETLNDRNPGAGLDLLLGAALAAGVETGTLQVSTYNGLPEFSLTSDKPETVRFLAGIGESGLIEEIIFIATRDDFSGSGAASRFLRYLFPGWSMDDIDAWLSAAVRTGGARTAPHAWRVALEPIQAKGDLQVTRYALRVTIPTP